MQRTTGTTGTTGTVNELIMIARRGSALIIVVGVLALVAVLSAIYISIGQSDTRTAAALDTRRDRDALADVTAGYLATVIAQDRLDTYFAPTGSGTGGGVTGQISRREAFDYPYTDYSVRSTDTGSTLAWALFNPSGRHTLTGAQGPAPDDDPRVPYDPWLSSTLPEYLGPADLTEDAPTSFGRIESRARRRSYWMDNRDWRHISNLSPDGRFVNLFNLRRDEFEGTRGGFDALPGVGDSPDGTYDDGGALRRRAMTSYLSLLGPADDTAVTDLPLRAFDPLADGFWFAGADQRVVPIFPDGETNLYNVPALWSTNQRFMFFPMNQAFYILNRDGVIADWSSPDYPAYQYADADGDGMADSRWFEMTDASDPLAIDPLISDPDYRVFAAARVMDLSALLNVNAHGDQTIPPTLEYPTGSSLAEIDLRRLLMMSDPGQNFNAAGENTPRSGPGGLSLQHLDHPARTGTSGDPTQIYRGTNPRSSEGRALGYDAIRPNDATAAQQLNPSSVEMITPATGEIIGQLAYDAIRLAIDKQTTIGRDYFGVLDTSVPGAFLPAADKRLIRGSHFWYDSVTDPDRMAPMTSIEDRAERRERYAQLVGSRDITRPGEYASPLVAGAGTGVPSEAFLRLGAGLFDLNDLAELLTYRGINDPSVTTRLETTVSGVMENGLIETEFSSRRLSPLLSNRPLELDRFGHGDGSVRVQPFPNVTGAIDWQSMALFELSIRSVLTTHSGVAPRRDHRAGVGADLTSAALAPTVGAMTGSVRSGFGTFAPALAPQSDVVGGWIDDMRDADPGVTASNEYRTVAYGHNSSEQALTIAAHLALNFKDMYDTDTVPTASTLLLDEAARIELNTDAAIDNTRAFDRRFPWWDGTGLDPEERGEGLPGGGSVLSDERRRVRNLFGVEPQPFLVEVNAVLVLTDAPEDAGIGGDVDYTSIPSSPAARAALFELPGLAGPRLSHRNVANITIDTELSTSPIATGSNADVALQALVFKLYNPFDEPVAINAGMRWDEVEDRWVEWEYYIEFAGRFFVLGQAVEFEDGATSGTMDDVTEPVAGDVVAHDGANETGPYRGVTIPAGESRTFFVLAHNELGNGEDPAPDRYDSRLIDQHWENIINAYGGAGGLRNVDRDQSTGLAVDFLKAQTGRASSYRIKEFDPETGRILGAMPSTGGTPGTGQYRDIFRDVTVPVAGINLGTPVNVTLNNTQRVSTQNVRLWRRLADPNGEELDNTDTNELTYYNVVENDLLADRLSSGAPAGVEPLNPHQPLQGLGNQEVLDTISFSEDADLANDPCAQRDAYERSGGSDPGTFKRNDNTGWSMALWATVRRPYLVGDRGRGQLPPGMIEVRDPMVSGTSAGSGPGDTEYKNVSRRWDEDTGSSGLAMLTGTFDASDFTRLCAGEGANFKRFDRAVDFDTNPNVELAQSLADLRRNAEDREFPPLYTIALDVEVDVGSQNTGDPIGGLNYQQRVNEKFQTTSWNLGANSYNETINFATPAPAPSPQFLQPELFPVVGSGETARVRPADVLTALGVGPVQSPHPDRAGGYDPDAEWITLSEMLAIALGYDVPEGQDPVYTFDDDDEAAERLDDPYVGLVNEWTDLDLDGTNDLRYVLPDARVALEDFVPFFDVVGGNRVFDPAMAPGTNDGDIRAGMGVPMAMDAVSRVRMHAARQPDSVPDTEWNEIERPVIGMININTAPSRVLRLLPGLTPNLDTFDANGDLSVTPPLGSPPSATSDQREWWVAQYDATGSSGLPALDGTFVNTRPDIAATLTAYRDRLYPQWRVMSDPNGDGSNAPQAGAHTMGTETELRFDPIVGAPVDFGLLAGDNMRSDVTRGETNGIRGVRETPGFAGIGEVLAATLRRENPDGTPNANFDDYRHLSIQSLGIDSEEQSVVDLGDETASIESAAYDDEDDEITDDLGERLAVANGILGSISVSSDVYAVWFVVHAYRESDVEDLGQGDPLVPSYARRFMMVVDRSNVVTADDLPRIVLLKEVPM